jgi:hypothetical protein
LRAFFQAEFLSVVRVEEDEGAWEERDTDEAPNQFVS